jgi:hypothetical protein
MVPVPLSTVTDATLWLTVQASLQPRGEVRTMLEQAATDLQEAVDRWAARDQSYAMGAMR